MNRQLRSMTMGIATGLVMAAVGGLQPAQAALQTIVGTAFDLTYDDTQLGLFGTPTLVGNTLFFTVNNFAASSTSGAVSANSTITGLVVTAKDGYSFGGFNLAEFGDYTLSGSGSLVRVQGQLRAFNTAASLSTQTTASLVVNPATPLTLVDGLNHDWSAGASINASTAPVPTPFGTATNVIQSGARSVGLTIENRLLAFTDPVVPGLREAFIEKKFGGVQLEVVPIAAVPLPAAALLFVPGLGLLAAVARRRTSVRLAAPG